MSRFAQPRFQSPDSLGSHVADDCEVTRLKEPQEAVRTGLQGMTDEQREAAIKLAGQALLRHYAEWERTGCFAAKGMADRARSSMEKLIQGRSIEQVVRMERERGFL